MTLAFEDDAPTLSTSGSDAPVYTYKNIPDSTENLEKYGAAIDFTKGEAESTDVDLGYWQESGITLKATKFTLLEDGTYSFFKDVPKNYVVKYTSMNSLTTEDRQQNHGITIGGGRSDKEISFEQKDNTGQGLVVDLGGKVAYGLDIELGAFYTGLPTTFSYKTDDTEAETAYLIFYKNGEEVGSASAKGAQDGSQQSSYGDVIDGGFDKVVILANDNGTASNDFVVRKIGFSTKPQENPVAIIKGSVEAKAGADGFADADADRPVVFSLEQDSFTVALDQDASKEFTVNLVLESGGKFITATYDANENIDGMPKETKTLFTGTINKDGSWTLEQYKDFAIKNADSDELSTKMSLPIRTSNDYDGDYAVAAIEVKTNIPEDVKGESGAATSGLRVTIGDGVGSYDHVLGYEDSGHFDHADVAVHVDQENLSNGTTLTLKVSSSETTETTHTLLWNGEQFVEVSKGEDGSLVPVETGGFTPTYNAETGVLSWSETELPSIGTVLNVSATQSFVDSLTQETVEISSSDFTQKEQLTVFDKFQTQTIREIGLHSGGNYIANKNENAEWDVSQSTDENGIYNTHLGVITQKGSFAVEDHPSKDSLYYKVLSKDGNIKFSETTHEDDGTITLTYESGLQVKSVEAPEGFLKINYDPKSGNYEITLDNTNPLTEGPGWDLNDVLSVALKVEAHKDETSDEVLAQTDVAINLQGANARPELSQVHGGHVVDYIEGAEGQILSNETSAIAAIDDGTLRTNDLEDTSTRYYIFKQGAINKKTSRVSVEGSIDSTWAADENGVCKYSADELLYTEENLKTWLADYTKNAGKGSANMSSSERNNSLLSTPDQYQGEVDGKSVSVVEGAFGKLSIDTKTGEYKYEAYEANGNENASVAQETFHLLVLDDKKAFDIKDITFCTVTDKNGVQTISNGSAEHFISVGNEGTLSNHFTGSQLGEDAAYHIEDPVKENGNGGSSQENQDTSVSEAPVPEHKGVLTLNDGGSYSYEVDSSVLAEAGGIVEDTFTVIGKDSNGMTETSSITFRAALGQDNTITYMNGKSSLFSVGDQEAIVKVASDNGSSTIIMGTNEADTIIGTAKNDLIFGGDGNDSIDGSAGNDTILGGAGNDKLSGGTGNDRLLGEAGNDTLTGDAGKDLLFGGVGDNILIGDNDDIKLSLLTDATSQEIREIGVHANGNYICNKNTGSGWDISIGKTEDGIYDTNSGSVVKIGTFAGKNMDPALGVRYSLSPATKNVTYTETEDGVKQITADDINYTETTNDDGTITLTYTSGLTLSSHESAEEKEGFFSITYDPKTGDYQAALNNSNLMTEDANWYYQKVIDNFKFTVSAKADGVPDEEATLASKDFTFNLKGANARPELYQLNAEGELATDLIEGQKGQVISSESKYASSFLRSSDLSDLDTTYAIMNQGATNTRTSYINKTNSVDYQWARAEDGNCRYSEEERLYTEENLHTWLKDYTENAGQGVNVFNDKDNEKKYSFLSTPDENTYSTEVEGVYGTLKINSSTGEYTYTAKDNVTGVTQETFNLLVRDKKGAFDIKAVTFRTETDENGTTSYENGSPSYFIATSNEGSVKTSSEEAVTFQVVPAQTEQSSAAGNENAEPAESNIPAEEPNQEGQNGGSTTGEGQTDGTPTTGEGQNGGSTTGEGQNGGTPTTGEDQKDDPSTTAPTDEPEPVSAEATQTAPHGTLTLDASTGNYTYAVDADTLQSAGGLLEETFTIAVTNADGQEVETKNVTFRAALGEDNEITYMNGEASLFTVDGASAVVQIAAQDGASTVIMGTMGDDVIQGTGKNDTIFGGAGDDKIDAGDGNDTVHGGAGDDEIKGGAGDDTIFGGAGDDKIIGGKGSDTIDGGTGYDVVQDGDGTVVNGVFGTLTLGKTNQYDVDSTHATENAISQETFHIADDEGNVTDLTYQSVGETSRAVTGDAVITSGNIISAEFAAAALESVGEHTGTFTTQADHGTVAYTVDPTNVEPGTIIEDTYTLTIDGKETQVTFKAAVGENGSVEYMYGRSDLLQNNGTDTTVRLATEDDKTTAIFGTKGNDTIEGTNGIDAIYAGDGNDQVSAGAGSDTIYAGSGDDTVDAGDGNDTVHGGAGDDEIKGGAGDDTIHGDDGEDKIDAGDGNDTVHGGAGNDEIHGGAGNDTIDGGDDNDTIYGDDGEDTLFGGNGNDIINGGEDADTIHGGDGNDTINGEEGDDTLFGDDGEDVLFGGLGNDYLNGGLGSDRVSGGEGNDIINFDVSDLEVDGGEGVDFLAGGNGTIDAFVDSLNTEDSTLNNVEGAIETKLSLTNLDALKNKVISVNEEIQSVDLSDRDPVSDEEEKPANVVIVEDSEAEVTVAKLIVESGNP